MKAHLFIYMITLFLFTPIISLLQYKTKLSMKAHLRMEDRLIEENKQLSQQLENGKLS